MGYQRLPKEKKNKIGREREIILSFSEGTVNSGERRKKWNYKTILAASFAKQTYFHRVLPITATNLNRLHLSESKKLFLIVREKATLLSTRIEIPLLSPTSPAHCSWFSQRGELLPPSCKTCSWAPSPPLPGPRQRVASPVEQATIQQVIITVGLMAHTCLPMACHWQSTQRVSMRHQTLMDHRMLWVGTQR